MGHLHKHSLCFDITLTAATTESVYPQPLAHISTETCQRNIACAPHPRLISRDENDIDYGNGPFLILTPGKVSGNKMFHQLGPLHVPTYSITNLMLVPSMKKFRHPMTESKKLIAICACFNI